MKFVEHVKLTPQAVIDTLNFKHSFKKIPDRVRRLYIIGSGSSYSQALYLASLFNEHSRFKAICENPYSFVKYSNFDTDDLCIHFSQEAKRNDNICPIRFAKKKGGHTILFTSKPETPLVKDVDEVYWYAPEVEKILVASMSYAAGYAAALKYFSAQMNFNGRTPINYDIEEIEKSMNRAWETEYGFKDVFTVYLYSGYGQSIAVEGALKVNECLLQDGEAYEIKHYSHGKHFVSYNRDRLYNVIYHEKDQNLVDLYRETIFEKHHLINYMKSSSRPEIAIFDWLMQMLVFTAYGMKKKNIELKDMPIRDKIKIPHDFKY